MKRLSFAGGSRGFSLVEVALALGILAFAIVGVLGLLTAGSSTNQQSERDHLLVAMTGRVVSDLRGVPFGALWQADPRAAAVRGSVSNRAPGEPVDSVYYFSADGLLLSDSSAHDAMYRCTVKKSADEATRSYGGAEVNLLKLELVFQWPAFAPAAESAGPKVRRIHASIARY